MTEEIRLTEPQRRHLREMVGANGETLYWKPMNSGERRCAWKLRKLGLLEGSFLTYNDAYELSEVGLAIARALKASSDPVR